MAELRDDSYYDRKYGPELSMTNPRGRDPDAPDLLKPRGPKFRGGVDEVIGMAVEEMGQRLKDAPNAIPAHVLVKFVAESNRAADRKKDELEKEEKIKQERSLLDQISSLPRSHGVKLIDEEIARLYRLIDTYVEAKKEL